MISKTDNFWRKDAQRGEIIIYELLGRHPRIVSYPSHGYNPISFELLLQHHPWGDLNWYLQQHPEVPFQDRLAWAVEIAQGIAYLHSKEVVWNDMHLGKVLVTDDLHIVLCDFGGSYVKPDPTYFFKIGPPLPYIWPDGYYGQTIKRQDIFGFGVIIVLPLVLRHLSMNSTNFSIRIRTRSSTPCLKPFFLTLHESSITVLEFRTSPALTCFNGATLLGPNIVQMENLGAVLDSGVEEDDREDEDIKQ